MLHFLVVRKTCIAGTRWTLSPECISVVSPENVLFSYFSLAFSKWTALCVINCMELQQEALQKFRFLLVEIVLCNEWLC